MWLLILSAFVYATFLWWLATGVVLRLNRLSGTSRGLAMGISAALSVVSLYAIFATRDADSVTAAYCAFSSAVLIWAAIEMSYFMGFVTGPSSRACPPGLSGIRRFAAALKTSLHHELLVAAVGTALFALTAGATNRTAAWTFLVLWLMRWGAKLNLFLGVRNLYAGWLPEPMRYLTSYMRSRPMNLLFPLIVTASTLIAGWLAGSMLGSDSPAAVTRQALVLAMLTLAIIEHWLLILPVSGEALWEWGSARARGPGRTARRSES